ncbi:MAG: hypothetical protein ABJD68_18165, partial [Nakamurella sp.]
GAEPIGSESRRHRSRLVLIAAAVAALLAAATVITVLWQGNIAGTPSAARDATATLSTTESGATAPSSVVSSSAAPPPTIGQPVPGLPHSAPLADQVMLASRAVDGGSNLFQYDAATGALGQQLTTGSPGTQFAVLSPDRGSMIYIQTSAAGNTLRTAAVDGTGDRALFVTVPADCTGFNRPAWNPIDQTVLALPCVTPAGVTVHRVLVDGTEQDPISIDFPFVDDLTYSPDGARLAYWAAPQQGADSVIYTQSAAGGPPSELYEPVAGANDADPAYSPDGSKIAFRRLVADAAGTTTGQLFVVGTDGSPPIALTDGTSLDQDPSWSPDGTQIAFKSNRTNAAGTRDNQIWVINTDGTGLRELAVGSPGTGDGAPAWGHR